jgi:hypothetical protein
MTCPPSTTMKGRETHDEAVGLHDPEKPFLVFFFLVILGAQFCFHTFDRDIMDNFSYVWVL